VVLDVATGNRDKIVRGVAANILYEVDNRVQGIQRDLALGQLDKARTKTLLLLRQLRAVYKYTQTWVEAQALNPRVREYVLMKTQQARHNGSTVSGEAKE